MFPKEELGNRAVHRNPILVDTAHRVGLIEKAGSGIKRIKKMIADNESEVIFETGEFFSTIFLREQTETVQVSDPVTAITDPVKRSGQKDNDSESGAIGEKKSSPKSSPMILELISKNPKITTEEMIKATKLTRRGIEYQLAKLKQEGIIKREGSRKTGYWVIIRKNVE